MRGPFQPTWQSLEGMHVPEWYLDAKFGIFIHWGAYSVPAFGSEWYPREMYRKDTPEFKHHVATYGPQSKFGYKDFIPRFTAEKFDAARWAELFSRAGARYVVPVAEHHDGFPMYDCGFTDWSAAKMGPKRDVIGELATAVRAKGLHFGVSSHRAEHWWFFDQGMLFDSDVRDSRFAGLYGPARSRELAEAQREPPDKAFLDDWLARTSELVDKYRPELVWFDWWIGQPAFEPYLRRFAAFYYNRGVESGSGAAINYKYDAFPARAAVLDLERGQLASIRPLFWQTDTAISKNSWGYVRPQDYKTADSIVDDLVDIVSKNGCLLLNIGPRPDGTIPEEEQKILLEIGRWLETNGEAIYGTRPWRIFGEGPTRVAEGMFTDTKRAEFGAEDFRFTESGGNGGVLYAVALGWPANGRLEVKTLAKGAAVIGDVKLLGYAGALDWKQTARGLEVKLPAKRPCDYAYALKITDSAYAWGLRASRSAGAGVQRAGASSSHGAPGAPELAASSPPADCPFAQSTDIGGIAFTGRHAEYTGADTWYPSWASDGKLYSSFTDGTVAAMSVSSGGKDAATGHAVIEGDDPLHLKVTPIGTWPGSPEPYEGRYPCGSLAYDGVWYYGTYALKNAGYGLNWPVLGPCPGFYVSRDFGKTWTNPALSCAPGKALFPEPKKLGGPVKIGAPHFVDFGKNMEHSPDGKAYLVGHGATEPDMEDRVANLSWITGDQVYLCRVRPSPETINDVTKYEFYGGRDEGGEKTNSASAAGGKAAGGKAGAGKAQGGRTVGGKPVWTSDFRRIEPLLEWDNNMGCVTITYDAPLKKYLMCVTDGTNTVWKFNTYILEADEVEGPWRLVAYLRDFGEQAYFVNFPSKFISADGRTLWMCYAANFTNGWLGTNLRSDPPGSRYGLCLQEVRLLGK
jgi:alpha-L-fucosidase